MKEEKLGIVVVFMIPQLNSLLALKAPNVYLRKLKEEVNVHSV